MGFANSCASAVFPHKTDPTIIVPVYSSGIFTDEARLLFCLVAHPFILEFCLHMSRQQTTGIYDTYARIFGHDPENINDLNNRELFNEATATPLIVEAVLVFNRRFLIG